MATKRGGGESISSGAPPSKKLLTQFEPVKIGRVASLEDMDIKVLQFQNRKLVERIEQRRRAEDELKRRIEQLEQRQATDDTMLCTVNRYWNQLDEDIRILLQRFDAEVAEDTEIEAEECEATTSFLSLLSQLDKNELDDKLSRRIEFSERSVGKLLHVFDRLMQRKDKLYEQVRTKEEDTLIKDSEAEIKLEPLDSKSNLDETKSSNDAILSKINVDSKQAIDPAVKPTLKSGKISETLNEVIKHELEMLGKENKALHELNTQIHQKHHTISLENSRLQDRLSASETETAELKNQVEDLEYELMAARHKIDKMDRYLVELSTKLNTFQEGEIQVQGGGEGVSKNKFNEIAAELEEQRELATTRLGELEKLQEDHENLLKEKEKLKMDITMLPESVIIESTEYKCLQSQFSVLYNESLEMKNQLDEARALLVSTKNAHIRQIEQMEVEELSSQKRLRTEMIEMEDTHAQVRREYELLRMEYEQTIVANEQTGPINREMRNLISSLKNHNEQLKGEVQRFKRKHKEAQADNIKLRSELQLQQISNSDPDSQGEKRSDEEVGLSCVVTGETCVETDLRAEIKKYQEKEKELKYQVDSYKNLSKEQRDKVQLMASEKKFRMEVEELRQQIRRPSETDKTKLKKDEDVARRFKKLEDTITDLQKSLAAQKQQEETMIGDMEVTGQAFEDMQEQNVRLLQQLREKDDANFKLMSERIKSNQMQKLLREEKELLMEQVETLQNQLEAQNVVVRKLEEKEAILVTTINTMDKEISLRQQSGELHKRKAIESAQTSADLKLHLDKYQSQLKDAQIVVTDKTATLQQQTFKYKRMQEDIAALRRKLERVKKIESASSADEVLLEEIREYKEQLTCPSCKVRKKDAVLTKCFHVFCLDCLKTRYETRQRKCPKCNATFGANDYHRIYLE